MYPCKTVHLTRYVFSLFCAIFRRSFHEYKIALRLSQNFNTLQYGVGFIVPNSVKSAGHVERIGSFIVAKSEGDKSVRSATFKLDDNIKMNLKERHESNSSLLVYHGELQCHFMSDVSK
jgi:hypothetical protein